MSSSPRPSWAGSWVEPISPASMLAGCRANITARRAAVSRLFGFNIYASSHYPGKRPGARLSVIPGFGRVCRPQAVDEHACAKDEQDGHRPKELSCLRQLFGLPAGTSLRAPG